MGNSVLPGTTPNGTPIESFPETNATSYTWTVNIESGTSFHFFSQGCNQPRIGTYIGFTLRDGDGALAQSAALTIEAGCRPSLFLTSLLLTWFFSIVFLLDWYVGKSCLVSRVLMLCAGGSSVSGASTSTPAGATATSPS